MNDDPIVAEVRKNRQAILESFNWDFEKMTRDVMKRQLKSGHKLFKRRDKIPCQQGVSPNAYPLRRQA